MRVLLDTHLILWWEAGSPRLPTALPDILEQVDVAFVSRASLWEMAIKLSLGKAFAENVQAHGFEWLEITNQHLFEVARLPAFDDHRDPFDRLLVAQSIREPLHLLTADKNLQRYGESVVLV